MKDLSIRDENQGFLVVNNLNDAVKASEIISRSNFVPQAYKGQPGDVLVAMQMGAELGLKPMQALQNIAVINGRPSLWGDAMLALCMAQPDFVDCIETYDESTNTAKCVVKRKGKADLERTFSEADARLANLWGRATWKAYPKRMLQMRARGFALRDAFPHYLRGLVSSEEAQDYPEEKKVKQVNDVEKPAQPAKPQAESLADELGAEPVEAEICKSKEELLAEINYFQKNEMVDGEWLRKCAERANADTLEDLNENQLESIVKAVEKKLEAQ